LTNKEDNFKSELMKDSDPFNDMCFFKTSKGVLIFDGDYNPYYQIGVYYHKFKDGKKAFYLKVETKPSTSMIYDIIPISKEHAKKLLNAFWDYFVENEPKNE